jgi:hypothetical protein
MTPKREAFAVAVASGKTQADAYRAAFNAAGMKAETIQQAASRLMADSKVAARVAELRKPIADKAQITLESHLRDLERLRNLAEDKDQLSAAISAEVARGKHAGVVAPEKKEHTGAGGGPIQTVTRIELVARRV